MGALAKKRKGRGGVHASCPAGPKYDAPDGVLRGVGVAAAELGSDGDADADADADVDAGAGGEDEDENETEVAHVGGAGGAGGSSGVLTGASSTVDEDEDEDEDKDKDKDEQQRGASVDEGQEERGGWAIFCVSGTTLTAQSAEPYMHMVAAWRDDLKVRTALPGVSVICMSLSAKQGM